MSSKKDVATVDLQKLVNLYCFVNNGIQGVRRKRWWEYIFCGNDHEEVEDYFSRLITMVAEVIESGYDEKVNISREITPFYLDAKAIKQSILKQNG